MKNPKERLIRTKEERWAPVIWCLLMLSTICWCLISSHISWAGIVSRGTRKKCCFWSLNRKWTRRILLAFRLFFKTRPIVQSVVSVWFVVYDWTRGSICNLFETDAATWKNLFVIVVKWLDSTVLMTRVQKAQFSFDMKQYTDDYTNSTIVIGNWWQLWALFAINFTILVFPNIIIYFCHIPYLLEQLHPVNITDGVF